MLAGRVLQQILAAKLGSSDSTAVRRALAGLLQDEWDRRTEMRDSLLRAPLLIPLSDPDGELCYKSLSCTPLCILPSSMIQMVLLSEGALETIAGISAASNELTPPWHQ